MKKLFLLFFISLLSIGVYTQDLFSVGVKAGYTSTKFMLDNYDQRLFKTNYKAQSGYLAGIYIRARVFRGLSVQPELYLSQKSGVVNLEVFNPDLYPVDSSFITTIKSIDLPLLLHLRLLDFDVANVYLVGGPVISFLSDGKTDAELGYSFMDSNWTMMFGGGVEFWRFTVDARYEWSLNNSALVNNTAMKDVGSFYNMLTVSVAFKVFGL